MKSLKAVECTCDGKMKQRGHIIKGDGDLSYWKMETASFLMPPLRKSRYKSRLLVSNKHAIKGLNPMTTTNPLISVAGLPNF